MKSLNKKSLKQAGGQAARDAGLTSDIRAMLNMGSDIEDVILELSQDGYEQDTILGALQSLGYSNSDLSTAYSNIQRKIQEREQEAQATQDDYEQSNRGQDMMSAQYGVEFTSPYEGDPVKPLKGKKRFEKYLTDDARVEDNVYFAKLPDQSELTDEQRAMIDSAEFRDSPEKFRGQVPREFWKTQQRAGKALHHTIGRPGYEGKPEWDKVDGFDYNFDWSAERNKRVQDRRIARETRQDMRSLKPKGDAKRTDVFSDIFLDKGDEQTIPWSEKPWREVYGRKTETEDGVNLRSIGNLWMGPKDYAGGLHDFNLIPKGRKALRQHQFGGAPSYRTADQFMRRLEGDGAYYADPYSQYLPMNLFARNNPVSVLPWAATTIGSFFGGKDRDQDGLMDGYFRDRKAKRNIEKDRWGKDERTAEEKFEDLKKYSKIDFDEETGDYTGYLTTHDPTRYLSKKKSLRDAATETLEKGENFGDWYSRLEGNPELAQGILDYRKGVKSGDIPEGVTYGVDERGAEGYYTGENPYFYKTMMGLTGNLPQTTTGSGPIPMSASNWSMPDPNNPFGVPQVDPTEMSMEEQEATAGNRYDAQGNLIVPFDSNMLQRKTMLDAMQKGDPERVNEFIRIFGDPRNARGGSYGLSGIPQRKYGGSGDEDPFDYTVTANPTLGATDLEGSGFNPMYTMPAAYASGTPTDIDRGNLQLWSMRRANPLSEEEGKVAAKYQGWAQRGEIPEEERLLKLQGGGGPGTSWDQAIASGLQAFMDTYPDANELQNQFSDPNFGSTADWASAGDMQAGSYTDEGYGFVHPYAGLSNREIRRMEKEDPQMSDADMDDYIQDNMGDGPQMSNRDKRRMRRQEGRDDDQKLFGPDGKIREGYDKFNRKGNQLVDRFIHGRVGEGLAKVGTAGVGVANIGNQLAENSRAAQSWEDLKRRTATDAMGMEWRDQNIGTDINLGLRADILKGDTPTGYENYLNSKQGGEINASTDMIARLIAAGADIEII